MSIDPSIVERVAKIRARIEAAATKSGRDLRDITLLGASKVQSPEHVCAAIEAGVGCLGENYVREAAGKIPAVNALVGSLVPPRDTPRWHMIGALQSNKAKLAVSLFDMIETVDRASLAIEIDKRARAAGKTIDVLIQVNLCGEAQKAGVGETEVGSLLRTCADLENVRVTGLMTIPRAVEDPTENRSVFARLRALRDSLRSAAGGERLQVLSMGMSKDFEIAIEEGATVVRVGSDLFGPRPPKA